MTDRYIVNLLGSAVSVVLGVILLRVGRRVLRP